MKFKGVIFDLDGTLACTLPDLRESLNTMLRRCGYPEITEELLYKNVSYCVQDYIRYSLPEAVQSDDAEAARCLEIYQKIYEEHYCDHTYFYEGLTEVLRTLKQKGVWLAVHTNKHHEHAVKMVEKLAEPGVFTIVMGEGCCPAKPDPTGALHLIAESGLDASQFCYIGDSFIDMRTAKNAGLFAIGVSWGYNPTEVLVKEGADVLVHHPSEILDVLGFTEGGSL